MAESIIKIQATTNEMNKNFYETPSKYYYIKYFNGEKNYKGKDNIPIVFETLIRHNEIGNRSIERNTLYTFESLEKILEEKVKEYEREQALTKEDGEYTYI